MSIMKNSIFLISSRVLQLGVGFFILVAVARYLSVEQYGEYSFIVAFVTSITALVYFGIQQVVIREMAKDRDKAAHYLGVAILLRLVISVIVIFIFVVVMCFMKMSVLTQTAMIIALTAEILLSFNMLFKAVFQAFEKMLYEPLLTVIFSILLGIFISTVIYFDMGMLWLFIATASANMIQLMLAYNIITSKFVRPITRDIDAHMFVAFFKYTTVVGLGIFFYINCSRINLLMLKWLCSTKDVALFNAPFSMIMQLMIIPTAVVMAIFPVMSRLLNKELLKVFEIYQKTARYLLILSLIAAICLSVFSHEIILIVFGRKFINSSPALMIIAWACVPLSIDILLNSVLIAIDKQKYSVFYGAAALLINFIAAFFILPHYNYIGASFLAVFTYTFIFLCSLCFVEKNGFPAIFDHVAAKTFAIGIISAVAMVFLKQVSVFLAIPVGIALYFLLVFKILPAEDLLLFQNAVQGLYLKRRR